MPHSRSASRGWPRTPFTMRGWSWLLAFLLLAGVFGAHRGVEALRQPALSGPREQLPLYDLQRDEALGGHTLTRHVGRSDEELAERLHRERQISAASTYTDLLTARRTVALAIDQSRGRIHAWESRRGSRPNLVLNYTQRAGPPIGRSLARGERTPRPCSRALIVLRWLERERRWIVLTSYPETR